MSVLKKIFFLSLFLLIVSVFFWGVYNLSFKNKSAGVPVKNTSATKNSATANEKITPLSNEAVIAPIVSSDGNNLEYLSAQTGQLMQVDFYGNEKKTISSKNISHLTAASWSVDKTKLIIQTTKNNSPAFFFYDPSTEMLVPLKNNLDEVVWQTNADRILYKYYDPQSKLRTLNVADPDGSHWTKLVDLDYKNLSIAQIPRTGLISFWNSGDAYLQTNFQSLPVIGGKAKTISTTGFGADYLWSNSGDWALVSHSDAQGGFKTGLGIMNANGGEYRNLDIPTFVSKCVWSKNDKTVYYALPGGIPNNSVLPNDYKESKFQTTDTFWKVDVSTGKKERLMETSNIGKQYDADQLFLNSSESLLFFVNKIDGKLYKITL